MTDKDRIMMHLQFSNMTEFQIIDWITSLVLHHLNISVATEIHKKFRIVEDTSTDYKEVSFCFKNTKSFVWIVTYSINEKRAYIIEHTYPCKELKLSDDFHQKLVLVFSFLVEEGFIEC